MGGEKKQRVPRRANRPLLVVVCLLVVLVTAVSGVMYALVIPHLDIASPFVSKPDMTSEEVKSASAATADITEEVESEAVVLLKDDGALPLGADAKVNVFGSTAGNNFSYGGTGSGSGAEGSNVSFYQGLENAGIQVNQGLKSFYDQNAPEAIKYALVGTDFNLYELPQSAYDQATIDDARAYSDTALVVLTRKGGEGTDLPQDMAGYSGSEAGRSYLELTPNEEDLLAMVEENFSNVVVVLNSPNAMELGFLDDDAVDAAIWVGTPGATGCNAIGRVLTGDVNPSGKTVDVFPYAQESMRRKVRRATTTSASLPTATPPTRTTRCLPEPVTRPLAACPTTLWTIRRASTSGIATLRPPRRMVSLTMVPPCSTRLATVCLTPPLTRCWIPLMTMAPPSRPR